MKKLINSKSLLKVGKMGEKRRFLKPGKTNEEDRINFVKYWANYIKTHSDEDWSEQQNLLIDAQIS